MSTVLARSVIVFTSTSETVMFWIVGTLAFFAGLGVVMAAKAVYSALFLAMTMLSLAVFYFVQDAMFLGVVQIVVYTGAVMMLFLFVMMLIGVDSTESLVETLRGQRVAAMVAGIGFGILLIIGIGGATMDLHRFGTPAAATGDSAGSGLTGQDNVEGLAVLVFTRYLWAFELTGALLITAAVGTMVLTQRQRLERRKTQRELSQERFQPMARPTPLPTPGVYARHNAVDMPALLPDGSYADDSVSRILRPRSVTRRSGRASAHRSAAQSHLRLVTHTTEVAPDWVDEWMDGSSGERRR